MYYYTKSPHKVSYLNKSSKQKVIYITQTENYESEKIITHSKLLRHKVTKQRYEYKITNKCAYTGFICAVLKCTDVTPACTERGKFAPQL